MEHHPKHPILTQEEIAKLAYEMYLVEGRPEGRDVHHWLKAERQVQEGQNQKQNPKASATAAARADSGKVVVKGTPKKSGRRNVTVSVL